MPYDPGLAERLADIVEGRAGFVQKKMFGGIGWMLNGNMCVGIHKDWLIARIGEAAAVKAFREDHVKPMDLTGRPMKGWAMVAPQGVSQDVELRRHVERAVAFVRTLPGKVGACPRGDGATAAAFDRPRGIRRR